MSVSDIGYQDLPGTWVVLTVAGSLLVTNITMCFSPWHRHDATRTCLAHRSHHWER